jgi:hypothetical protein
LETRWEVTRRHPYYLVFWLEARHYWKNELGEDPAQKLLRHASAVILRSIGVTGEPVAPGLSFQQLTNGNLDPAFLTGSVQPITLRAIVAMLINALPTAERRTVGALLMTGGDDEYTVEKDDSNRTFQKQIALGSLMRLASPVLDSCPDAPLFYIHLGASQRSITRDTEEQATLWKRRRNIPERRVPFKKLASYLEVLDRREGWTGEGYVSEKWESFSAIAKETKTSVSTLFNRYRAAFELITGHPFSGLLWCRLFGPLLEGQPSSKTAKIMSARLRHRLSSPVVRPVPETVISPSTNDSERGGFVEALSAVPAEQNDLYIDIEDLSSRGLSDEEIATRLAKDEEDGQAKLSAQHIAEIRLRREEFRKLDR